MLTDVGGDVERLSETFDLDEQLEPPAEHMVDAAVPREVLQWEYAVVPFDADSGTDAMAAGARLLGLEELLAVAEAQQVSLVEIAQ